jgi:DNA primase
MFVVNEFANKWFHEQLWNTPEGTAVAMSYLRQSGLREDIIRKFQIGYSPEKAALWDVAKKKGFQEKYLPLVFCRCLVSTLEAVHIHQLSQLELHA